MKEVSINVKWLGIVLLFSLAVNFFLFGFLYSRNDNMEFKRSHKFMKVDERKKIMLDQDGVRLIHYFPKEQREEFRRALVDHKDVIKPAHQGISKAKKKIIKVLSQEIIGEGELDEVFDEYLQNNIGLQKEVHKIMINIMKNMDYETRQGVLEKAKRRKFMNGFTERHEHHKKYRDRRKDEDHRDR